MTIDEVKGFFEASKDDLNVKAYAQSFVTPERVGAFLESESGNTFIRSGTVPGIEKRVAEALKTFKENQFAKEVEAKVQEGLAARAPKETEADKKLREIMEDNAKTKRELEKERLMRSISGEAEKMKLPTFWAKHFGGSTIEEAKELMIDLDKYSKEIAQKAKDEILATAQKPGAGVAPDPKKESLMESMKGKTLQQVEAEVRASIAAAQK